MFPDLFRDDVFRLETRHLWLRWPRLKDGKAIHYLGNHPPIKWLPIDGTIGCDEKLETRTSCASEPDHAISKALQNNLLGRALTLMITLKSGARPVIGAIELSQDKDRHILCLRSGMDPEHQDQALEAVNAALNAVFSYTPYHGVRLYTKDQNPAVQKVLQDYGLKDDMLNKHCWNTLKQARKRLVWEEKNLERFYV
jgi:RimJ/RimL family protein N-acetyltransferase